MPNRILAVDDEPHMLHLLERIITEKTPYSVETLDNSLEAMRRLETERFDLIITDLKMPGKDGLDILEMVRRADRDEEVIIMTAFGSLESARKALALGVSEYITKPFKAEQILHAVESAMRRQRIHRAARRWEAVVAITPFELAVKSFEIEYVAALAAQHGSDPALLARLSGLPEQRVTAALAATKSRI